MGRLIFIIGGARSGKSRFSVELAKEKGKKVLFIATCSPKDEEMKKRIQKHKRSRPAGWKVVEGYRKISAVLNRHANNFDTIIIDCLGLFVTNLMMNRVRDKAIEKEITLIANRLLKSKTDIIVVSNEVGGGIVPDNPLARRFRDVLGISNQIMAGHADTVYMMQAGIPIKIKEQV
ncbi:MAG: bifunctional adenosylcobinamide kinase/adenosylcobinamide-phosphate guanylyltransferase [Candidatus Omnitrophica bacterium]|nr:bifunctional adenosylcobinamide kinase/adenosylcobinamide-phosphate guanylyltransferase [Candidatus Omnitrophota bacterium]